VPEIGGMSCQLLSLLSKYADYLLGKNEQQSSCAIVVVVVVVECLFNLAVMKPNSTIQDKHIDSNIEYSDYIYTIRTEVGDIF